MTTGGHSRVQRLSAADWRLLRDIRLRALKDSPDAFLSRYDDVVGWDESDWRSEFDATRWLVARDREHPVGLIRSVHLPAAPMSRHVESAWVDADHRRRGVLRLLVEKLVDLERRVGVRELFLWVFEHNVGAFEAYTRLGFEPTGEHQPVNGTDHEWELRLSIA